MSKFLKLFPSALIAIAAASFADWSLSIASAQVQTEIKAPIHTALHAKEWLTASALPGVRQLKGEERQAQIKRVTGQIAYNFEDAATRVMFHDGDLVVDGNLTNNELLIVSGNLTIKGNYHDYQDGIGVLVVLGNMQVDSLYSWGAISVEKDLNASGMILTVYNDFTFEVSGKVNARALVISDKSADYTRGEIEVVLSDSDSEETDKAIAYRTLLPEFFTGTSILEPSADDADWYLRFDDGLGEARVTEEGEFFRSTLGAIDLPKHMQTAMDPESSVSALKALIGKDPLLTQLIAARPNLPKALYAPLQAQGDAIANQWLAIVAPNLVLKGANAMRLSPALAEKAVDNPSTETAVLERIAADADPAIRIALTKRDELPNALINQLAADPDADVRAAVLNNVMLAAELDGKAIDARLSDVPAVLDALAIAKLNAAQMRTLLPKLSPAGVSTLARRLQSERFDGWPSALKPGEHDAIAIAILDRRVDTSSYRPSSPAFLALSAAEQLKRFDALTSARVLELDSVASGTRSLALMQKLWAMAQTQSPDGRSLIALGAKLAENPLLPETIALEMVAYASTLPKPDPDSYEDNHFDMLEDLFGNDDLDRRDGSGPLLTDKLLDAGVTLALKHRLGPDDEFLQPLLSCSISSELIARLDVQFGNSEDWALSKISMPRVNREQLHCGLTRWYDDSDLQAELRAIAKLPDAGYWDALAKAKAPELRQAAATRPELSAATLQKLLKDENVDVRRYANGNPLVTTAQRIALLKLEDDNALVYAKPSVEELDALLQAPITRNRRWVIWRLRAQAGWVLE